VFSFKYVTRIPKENSKPGHYNLHEIIIVINLLGIADLKCELLGAASFGEVWAT
jgi:hypothetical protein